MISCHPWVLCSPRLMMLVLYGLALSGQNVCLTAATSTRFEQRLIDQAVADELHVFGDGLQNWAMAGSKSIYFLALLAHLDPEAAASDGPLVRDRLVKQLKSITTGGQEPNANGSLAGWSHGSIAHAFALAKHTPEVWTLLTDVDRERIDWLMRAMAVAGHFSFDDDNDYRTGLAYEGNFHKRSNPNYREGYMSVMIAAALYFGADELNRIFHGFTYADYHAAFTRLGFTNVLARWDNAINGGLNGGAFGLRTVLENGGPARAGDVSLGQGLGVRNSFTYQGVGLDRPFELFKKLADYMYGPDDATPDTLWSRSAAVRNDLWVEGVRLAWTEGEQLSPVTGEWGMALEFRGHQGSAPELRPRSSVVYVLDAWTNSISTRATLEALRHWHGSDLAARDDVEARMRVGSEDLLFKVRAGYHSVHGGETLAMISETFRSRELRLRGYDYNREIWINFLRPLPGRYRTTDVGVVDRRGAAAYQEDTYVVSGLAAGVRGSADAFTFVHLSLAGDGAISAAPASPGDAQSGLMIRESLAAGARMVFASRETDGRVRLSWRAETDGLVQETRLQTAIPAAGAAVLRLGRRGDAISVQLAAVGAGVDIEGPLAVVSVSLPDRVYVGLAHAGTAEHQKAQFAQVSVVALPLPWTSAQVGAAFVGGVRMDTGTFMMAATGEGVGEDGDRVQFVHQPAVGDLRVTARVTAVEKVTERSSGGIQIRTSRAADAAMVALQIEPGRGVTFLSRAGPGADVRTSEPWSIPVPVWLRLVRIGDTISGFAREEGDAAEWRHLGSAPLSERTVLAGFYGASGASRQPGTITVEQVEVQSTAATPPSLRP